MVTSIISERKNTDTKKIRIRSVLTAYKAVIVKFRMNVNSLCYHVKGFYANYMYCAVLRCHVPPSLSCDAIRLFTIKCTVL